MTTLDYRLECEEAAQKLKNVRGEVKTVIFGQDHIIDQALIALLSGGHILLIGLPGLAKTKLVSTLSKVMGLDTKRIQCTPDLMPSDITGAEVLEEVDYGRRNFRFIQGPVFSQFLMVDEINRTSPRTQSALLQAMQEKHVTVAGREHDLPKPFHVLATQNPVEQEGIYPLPESQLDRFLLQISIDYPDRDSEKTMLQNTVMQVIEPIPRALIYANDLLSFQNLVRKMPLSDSLIETTLNVVRNARPESSSLDLIKKYVSWGPGPRASQSLALAIRARTLLSNSPSPTSSDLTALIEPVLGHRIGLNFAARADGISTKDIIKALTDSIPQTACP